MCNATLKVPLEVARLWCRYKQLYAGLGAKSHRVSKIPVITESVQARHSGSAVVARCYTCNQFALRCLLCRARIPRCHQHKSCFLLGDLAACLRMIFVIFHNITVDVVSSPMTTFRPNIYQRACSRGTRTVSGVYCATIIACGPSTSLIQRTNFT